jgi:hypothetical protein
MVIWRNCAKKQIVNLFFLKIQYLIDIFTRRQRNSYKFRYGVICSPEKSRIYATFSMNIMLAKLVQF